MTEEKKYYSEEEIVALLDKYLEVQRDKVLGIGKAPPQKPTPPRSGFENVRSLADYHNRVVEYEQEKRRSDDLRKKRDQERESVASEVRSVLPRGTYAIHTYQGAHSEIQGQFTITHSSGGRISTSAYNPQGMPWPKSW